MGERTIFPVFAMLLIHTSSLLPARALSKTLLFELCLLQTRDKERVEVLDDSATCSRVMTTVQLMCPNDHSDSR